MFKIAKNYTDELLTFKSQTKAFVAKAEELNAMMFEEARNAFYNNGNCDYYGLTFEDNKYSYEVVIIEPNKAVKGIESIQTATKELKVHDVFCLKATKNTSKVELNKDLANLLDLTCANLSKNGEAKKEARARIETLAKYDDELKAFVCETANGKTQLENQLNKLMKTIYGEGVLTVRKGKRTLEDGKKEDIDDIEFLTDVHNKAILTRKKAEYRGGSELDLLKNIMLLALHIKANRAYRFNGKNTSAKKKSNR